MSNVTQFDAFAQHCTGCQACAQICPVRAITMENASDGFLYPRVSESRCVDCGLCTKVCTMNSPAAQAIDLGVYSVQAKEDAVLSQCSSGGVFLLLAQDCLKRGGLIFGAAFDPRDKQVKHCSTDQVPLDRLLRSKYVQSSMGTSYQQTAEALARNRPVLFAGTPCQVRGLKQYLQVRKITGPLLTVDFKCHGVPSPGFFRTMLHQMERKQHAQVADVTFREKDLGWHYKSLKIYFENGKVWKRPLQFHYYGYYFENDYILRDSCYECEEYKNHISDLTLADDWISPIEKDERGTSLVLVHTKNGTNSFSAIQSQLRIRQLPANRIDMNVYCHNGYDRNKKQIWLKSWKEKGFAWVSGPLFWKSSGKAMYIKRLRFYASRIKNKVISWIKYKSREKGA